jgi:PAS domain S-box-containing protein
MALWHFTTRVPPIPRRPLRIGFEPNPPAQIRTATGFSGLAVETVNEAAKRAGIQLQWVETGTSSDGAFQKGLVDLWPLMADLPDRRKRVYISRPWLHADHVLLLPAGSVDPDRRFTGRIALFQMPLHARLLHERFSQAQMVPFRTGADAIRAVCTGAVSAAFLEDRVAMIAMGQKVPECPSVDLRVQPLTDLTIQLGVASTFDARGAADALRREIGNLFRDGTLAVMIAKYSYYGLDDAWATYDLMESEERTRWLKFGISALAMALALALWQAHSLRRARQAAELANVATSQALSRYQLVSRAAHGALFEYDLKSGNVVWNEAVQQLFRYAAERVGSDVHWWEERIHPGDQARVLARMESAIAQKEPTWADEYRFRRGDGTYAVVADRGHLLSDNGEPARLIRTVIDVTEQRALEEQLLEIQKMEAIGRLAGGIAHDFNNLLTVILGYGNLLADSFHSGLRDDPTERAIRELIQAADQAARLTQQLLAFSRRQLLRPQVLDLNTVITDMVGMMRRVLGEHAELVVTLAPNLGKVRADRGQIEQVVMNLCVNARDAMPAGGRLTLETANVEMGAADVSLHGDISSGPYVRLAVGDTGCGMQPETQAHIFEPFFTTKGVGRGTGLGLATTHGIVNQSGGSISVQSEPGRGSTFTVFLPRAAHAEVDQVPSPVARAETAKGNETILVVEDESAVREMTTAILRKHGYTVLAASNGETATLVAGLSGAGIDLLLTDVVMPRMNGYELAQQLTARYPALKVLCMSGYAQNAAPGPGPGREWPFVSKPFTSSGLLEKVREALDYRTGVANPMS